MELIQVVRLTRQLNGSDSAGPAGLRSDGEGAAITDPKTQADQQANPLELRAGEAPTSRYEREEHDER